MKRMILTMGASLLVAVPATMGLVGNTSFAQSVPVRIPSQATVLDDHGGQRATPSPTPSTQAGDDHGGLRATRTTEANHQNGTHHGTSTEARHQSRGDHGTSTEAAHHGGLLRHTHAEPGDDHGGLRAIPTTETSHQSAGDSGPAKGDNGVHGNDVSGKGAKHAGSGHT